MKKKYSLYQSALVVLASVFMFLNTNVAFAESSSLVKKVVKNANEDGGLDNFNEALNIVIMLLIVITIILATVAFYLGSYKAGRAIQSGNSSDMVKRMKDLSTMFWNTVIASASLTIVAIFVKGFFLFQGYGIT